MDDQTDLSSNSMESEATMEGIGPVVKVSTTVLKLVGPHAAKWTKAQFVGRRVLIVGPKNAGKTRFFRYLETKRLYPELPEREERARATTLV